MPNQAFQWQGRNDGEGEAHLRIHNIINQSRQATYALMGFCSDAGVKRNLGRIGAAAGPDAIRAQLANLPVHQPVEMIDLGNVICIDDQLEQAQFELAEMIDLSLQRKMMPIVLGGGHEVAFASFSGLFKYLHAQHPERRLGIINFDAHFDLRQAPRPSSGTPFLQAAEVMQQHGKTFNYMCLGVGKHSNTKVLFDTADALACDYLYDHEVTMANLPAVLDRIDQFMAKIDDLYVTIDLDVFTSALAPGVSAPAVKGVDLTTFEAIFQHLQRSGKIRLLDLAECNPTYDIDNKTAKLAAYIVFSFIFAQAESQT